MKSNDDKNKLEKMTKVPTEYIDDINLLPVVSPPREEKQGSIIDETTDEDDLIVEDEFDTFFDNVAEEDMDDAKERYIEIKMKRMEEEYSRTKRDDNISDYGRWTVLNDEDPVSADPDEDDLEAFERLMDRCDTSIAEHEKRMKEMDEKAEEKSRWYKQWTEEFKEITKEQERLMKDLSSWKKGLRFGSGPDEIDEKRWRLSMKLNKEANERRRREERETKKRSRGNSMDEFKINDDETLNQRHQKKARI